MRNESTKTENSAQNGAGSKLKNQTRNQPGGIRFIGRTTKTEGEKITRRGGGLIAGPMNKTQLYALGGVYTWGGGRGGGLARSGRAMPSRECWLFGVIEGQFRMKGGGRKRTPTKATDRR